MQVRRGILRRSRASGAGRRQAIIDSVAQLIARNLDEELVEALEPATVLVNIDVPDVDRGVAFYCAALGLSQRRRLGPDVVELGGAAVPVYLIRAGEGSAPFAGATTTRSYAPHWTPVHLDFVVSDIERAVRDALAAGAALRGAPRVEAWGKLALLEDPWGNGFCLIEFVGRGYDELA